jgi:hypothetical protein
MTPSSAATESAQVRSQLVTSLELELIGPTPRVLKSLAADGEGLEREALDRLPSSWYITGFLVPTTTDLSLRCAVMDMTSALETYRALDPAGQKQLLAEAAALGQKGLTINDPSQKHHLRHYKGGRTVSALQAACILYVGIQLLLPGQDAGIDLAREYAMARGMVGDGE